MAKDPKAEILEEIDRATEPRRMSQEKALDFLELLRDDIDMRIEGLKADIKNRD